jgi:hypothetical protein
MNGPGRKLLLQQLTFLELNLMTRLSVVNSAIQLPQPSVELSVLGCVGTVRTEIDICGTASSEGA